MVWSAAQRRGRARRARPPGWPVAGGIAVGVLADALAGDPQRGHPVALFGRAAAALEGLLYADRRSAGAAFTIVSAALAASPVSAAAGIAAGSAPASATLTAAVTWAVTGARSLTAEAARIRDALTAGDLLSARGLLPNLCGRDPQHLDASAITRAVVESVAENTSDAIVAPLLWGGLAGPSGLAGYRAINTLDAMVGHHSARYERFGWASARADDVINWLPARLTAALTAACAPAAGGSPAATWRAACRYGECHPSPNAGWCEAAFAGALGVRLGGPLSYGGRTEQRPELGAGRAPVPADITRAVRLSRAVTAGATAVAVSLAMA